MKQNWGWIVGAVAALGLVLTAVGQMVGMSLFIVAGIIFLGWLYYWLTRAVVAERRLHKLQKDHPEGLDGLGIFRR